MELFENNHLELKDEMNFDELLFDNERKFLNKDYSEQEQREIVKIQKIFRGYYIRRHIYPSLRFLNLVGQLHEHPSQI